jgi:hypothetical protein
MLKPQPQDIPSPSLRGGGAGGGGKGDPQTKFVRHVTLSTHGPCTKPGGTIEGLANPAPVAALSHSNAIVVCGSGHGCRNNAASQLRPALRAASGGRASGRAANLQVFGRNVGTGSTACNLLRHSCPRVQPLIAPKAVRQDQSSAG